MRAKMERIRAGGALKNAEKRSKTGRAGKCGFSGMIDRTLGILEEVGKMPAGRPKKPTAIHILNGNPSKIKDLEQLAEREIKPAEYSRDNPPPAPKYLSKFAKECWQLNAAYLAGLRLLTEADLIAFEAYCVSYGLYREAMHELKKAGGRVTYSPFDNNPERTVERAEVQSARSAMHEMREWAREFGMTPAARGRMTLPEADEAADDMEAILSAVK